jgi:hypothetical protein
MVVCAAVEVTVMMAFTVVFGPLPLTGDELQLASEGKPLQVKLTAVGEFNGSADSAGPDASGSGSSEAA